MSATLTLRTLIWPVAAALTITACSAATIISKVDISHNYQPLALGRFHGGDNAMAVVGYGSPFGDPAAQVSNTVVASMQGHNGGARMTFTTADLPPPRPRWRVVMAINPTEIRDTIKLCKLTETPTTARSVDGKVRILAAFCQGDYAASQATGRATGVTSLDSPNFDDLVARLTRTLFPARNPNDDRGRRCRIFPCP